MTRRWQDTIQSAGLAAAPLMSLAMLAGECDYLAPEHIEQHKDLIFNERDAPIGVLNMAGEDAAMLRIVLDAKKVRQFGLPNKEIELVDTLDAIERYTQDQMGSHSYLGYDIAHGQTTTPVIYLDFRGPEAQTDALQLYTQIQSFIEQQQGSSGPAR